MKIAWNDHVGIVCEMSLVDAVVTTSKMFDCCNRFNCEVVLSDIGGEKVGAFVFLTLIQGLRNQ